MIWTSSIHGKLAQTADFLIVIAGFVITYYILTILPQTSSIVDSGNIDLTKNVLLIIFLAFIYTQIFLKLNAYSYQRFTSLYSEYVIVLKVCLLGTVFFGFFFFLLQDKNLPRIVILISFLINTILLISEKTMLFHFAAYTRKLGWNRKRTLIIGTGTRAINFIETVKANFNWGLDIIGLISEEKSEVGESVEGYPIIDYCENIESALLKYNPEEVIITISTKRFEHIEKILDLCEIAGIQVKLNSDLFGHITNNVMIHNILGLNILSFNFYRKNEFKLLLKRLIDILLSGIGLIALSPILLLVGLIIYIQDGLPIFYKWEIVGYNRIPVKSWKFRTMVKNADDLKEQLIEKNEMTGPVFKMTDDPRILPIGKFLRKHSIDELPQLISVLKGDLSLIGPRPPLQYEFNEFELWQRRKLSVKPGLTCLWQISGRNSIADFDEWVKLDLKYIDNWSPFLDFKILIKTIVIVFTGKGAK